MADALGNANSLIEAGNLAGALEALTAAIDNDDSNAALYLRRAYVQQELGHDTECAMDIRSAFQVQDSVAKMLVLMDVHYTSPKFQAALAAARPAAAPAPAPESAPAPAPAATGPRITHDWYQTDKFVVVTIMLRNANKESVKCHFEENSVSVDVPLPSGSTYNLELDLFAKIVPSESTVSVLSTKIEVKLRKLEPIRWAKLEGDGEGAGPAPRMVSAEELKVVKPKDWDKLVEEEIQKQGEDKLEGEQAMNDLFKKIYRDGSDEVRRAMNKSYQESGGTVLSTNWSEIGAKRTEISPPNGLEFKKYN